MNNDASGNFVGSYNEWDVLKEVIVGIVDGASVPAWDLAVKASMPGSSENFFRSNAGKSFPIDLLKKAEKELEQFVSILESEGVIVRRPEKIDHKKPFATSNWRSVGGLYQAMPRDLLLVVGDLIIESPMAWRNRFFEVDGYRKLLKEYFNKGAKWVSAPKPQLLDELYDSSYENTVLSDGSKKYGITEFEPVFDAADFIRCGRDIFGQLSNVTNIFGVEWLKSCLGDKYTVHLIESQDDHPMHIDSTFMPIAPGHLLVNPFRKVKIPEIFNSWNIIYAPESAIPPTHPMYMSSTWVSTVNVLMIDEKRVLIEEQEQEAITLLKKNGFFPIPCPFRHFMSIGGSFHCATLDVYREGKLESYF